MSVLSSFFAASLSAYNQVLIIAYLLVFLGLAVYGFHRSQLVYLYYRYRDHRPEPIGQMRELPKVTVQLPLFNEMYVAQRLLDAVAQIRYPRDRFEIQVLDDSTDETTSIVARKVEEWRLKGFAISHVRRPHRDSFKAGALAAGQHLTKAQYFAIFDADYRPPPSFLRQTMAALLADSGLAFVQARPMDGGAGALVVLLQPVLRKN